MKDEDDVAKDREHQLINELRAARLELAQAAVAEEAARRIVLDKKTIRRGLEDLVEEVLDEITTGKRSPIVVALNLSRIARSATRARQPLIEYAESRAAPEPGRETAGERQRGPTDEPAETEAETSAHPFADYYAVEALHAACSPDDATPDWAKYRKLGMITDREVTAVLSSIWPAEHVYTSDDDAPGWTTFGGAAPVFWIGDKSGPGIKPHGLHGPDLADAVRAAFTIKGALGAPTSPGTPEPTPEPARPSKTKTRKPKPADAG